MFLLSFIFKRIGGNETFDVSGDYETYDTSLEEVGSGGYSIRNRVE